MAGYVKFYLVGGKGGYCGVDGINPINMIIGVGASDREWLSPIIMNSKNQSKPIWKLNVIIPDPDNYGNSIIDACIAFCPEKFKDCSYFDEVVKQVGNSERIEFVNEDKIPSSWSKLRNQALPIFEKMTVFEAKISEMPDKYPKWETY